MALMTDLVDGSIAVAAQLWTAPRIGPVRQCYACTILAGDIGVEQMGVLRVVYQSIG